MKSAWTFIWIALLFWQSTSTHAVKQNRFACLKWYHRPSNGRRISTQPAKTAYDCWSMCLKHANCTSFVVWRPGTCSVDCELRDQSGVNKTQLVGEDTVLYYTRKECDSSPCQHGGTCKDGLDGHICKCSAGFTGRDCKDVDECASSPCLNGGSCTDGVNQYTCVCASGYTGLHCESVDKCASSPCLNGGVCTDGVNQYTCHCTAGYTGLHCESDVDECASGPCMNGGVCTDGVNQYTCNCTAGYIGLHCESVDECASSPCLNGGVCTDGENQYTCNCTAGYTGLHCENVIRDCADVHDVNESSSSGVYTVVPDNGIPTLVYCDMDTDGGRWLVFQKRYNGVVDFYRNWEAYAAGFGDLHGEFWLGNRNLHFISHQKVYTLRIELGDWHGDTRYAEYASFSLGSEEDKFRLSFGAYTGDAGDSLLWHYDMPFTTWDQDNDANPPINCANVYLGAWWYNSCHQSNLNGFYYAGDCPYGEGVQWFYWRGYFYSLKSTTMMIRPVA